jgi:hypothetical protein
MHKGYAFVQFTNPFDARNACHGEDGRTVLNQVLGKFSTFMTGGGQCAIDQLAIMFAPPAIFQRECTHLS